MTKTPEKGPQRSEFRVNRRKKTCIKINVGELSTENGTLFFWFWTLDSGIWKDIN